MSATYTKLKDGSWGIRSTSAVQAGDQVTVTKKSGESKTETVGRVLWTGNGVWLCTVQQTSNGRASGGRRYGGGETKRCWECGCTFTYADCKRGGGDWGEGYCGC